MAVVLSLMAHVSASPIVRLYAVLVDCLCALFAFFAGALLGSLVAYGVDTPFFGQLAVFGLLIYQLVLLAQTGQTIGKKQLSIRIVDQKTGNHPGFVRVVLLRTLLSNILCFIPLYALVDALFIFREDTRCIHDHIAGTVVVKAGK